MIQQIIKINNELLTLTAIQNLLHPQLPNRLIFPDTSCRNLNMASYLVPYSSRTVTVPTRVYFFIEC